MIYPISPGLFCVPAAIQAITGEDLLSVIVPALNRAQENETLLGTVAGVRSSTYIEALQLMGYVVSRYKDRVDQPLRAQLKTWAKRFPSRPLLVATRGHAMALYEGRVFDTFTPHGAPVTEHPFARDVVVSVLSVRKRG